MKLSERINKAYSAFTGKSLGNSTGIVARNFSQAKYRPDKLTGIAYKAVDKIGLTLSNYEPMVIRANGEPYVNHPLLNLYDQPNPMLNSSSDFVHLYGMLMEIYGETFWYLAKGEVSNKPKEIYLLPPAQIELKISEGELVGYILHRLDGKQIPFELDEIIHDKIPNPFNEWRGQSILEKAAVYINTEISTAHFTLNYINNNASPSGIVSLPDMDPETFKTFASRWRENYEGPDNAGKTAFIRNGEASFQAVGATLKDIDQKITREMAKEDVLMMLDVPKPLLGATDDNGFGRANVETLEYIFAKNKLEPMMKRLDKNFQLIGNQLDPRSRIRIEHTSPIPEDKEFKHKMLKDFLNRALTVNEVRAELELEKLPDGDTLQPQNTVPMLERKKVVFKKEPTKAEKILQKQNEQEEFRQRLVRINDEYAPLIEKAISDFFGEQEKKVLSKLNASDKAFEEWLFEIRAESELMAIAVSGIMLDLLEAQIANAANWITGEVVQLTPEIKRDVNDRILRLAATKNKDIYKKLEDTISEGVKNGESLNKIKNRITDVYEPIKGKEAERIARTEGLRASNRANSLVYKENGYSRIRWFINPRACAYCQTFFGKEVEIGHNFVNLGDTVDVEGEDGKVNQMAINYDDVDVPPLHPNCTCSISPVR